MAEKLSDMDNLGSGGTIPSARLGNAWPIGAVFISVVSTNPNTLLGYGTWAAIGAGRVLVGRDAGDADFDTAEETGGAKTVASAGTVEATETGAVSVIPAGITEVSAQAHSHVYAGSATSVVQPYLVCYFWKRSA